MNGKINENKDNIGNEMDDIMELIDIGKNINYMEKIMKL